MVDISRNKFVVDFMGGPKAIAKAATDIRRAKRAKLQAIRVAEAILDDLDRQRETWLHGCPEDEYED